MQYKALTRYNCLNIISCFDQTVKYQAQYIHTAVLSNDMTIRLFYFVKKNNLVKFFFLQTNLPESYKTFIYMQILTVGKSVESVSSFQEIMTFHIKQYIRNLLKM